MNPAIPATEEESRPIVIYASRGFDSYTFALAIEDKEWLAEQFEGTVMPARRVTVALDTKAEFEKAFGAIEPQVVTLLTGLDPRRLDPLGGIEVRESKSQRVMWRPPSRAA